MLACEKYVELEEALASSLAAMICELRMIDISDYLGYVHYGAMDSLRSLVRDAADPFFSPGFVTLSSIENSGSDWGKLPAIKLYIMINGVLAQHLVSITLRDDHAEFKLEYSTPEPNVGAEFIWQKSCIAEIQNNRHPYSEMLPAKTGLSRPGVKNIGEMF